MTVPAAFSTASPKKACASVRLSNWTISRLTCRLLLVSISLSVRRCPEQLSLMVVVSREGVAVSVRLPQPTL